MLMLEDNNKGMPNMPNIPNMPNKPEMPNDMQKDEMIKMMMRYRFAALETGLYLDTHPNDLEVLDRHNYFCEELHKLSMQYMKKFNDPLTMYDTAEGFWTYIERWPWQKMYGGGK